MIRITATQAQPLGPTPERLAHANDNVLQDPITRAYHMRDTPLDRLHRTRLLNPDPDINNMLHTAGQRYVADFYAAGLSPLGAQDYERPIVDGASPKGESDFRQGAYERWRHAATNLGDTREVIDTVVLQERSVQSAGLALGLGKRDKARNTAMSKLKAGLALLARQYGLATN